MTTTALGHEEASVAAIPAQVPVLLLGGSGDAVIAGSRDRYRNDDALHDPPLPRQGEDRRLDGASGQHGHAHRG